MQKDDFGRLIDSKHPDCQNKFIKDVVNIIGEFWKR
jgi:RIO-like serine/threonine protein kinase